MVHTFGGGYFPGEQDRGLYYDREILEPVGFQFRKIKFASIAETMAPDVGAIGETCLSGFRVSTEYLPTKVRYDDLRPPLDFDTFDALYFLSHGAKVLIERFEPGKHQFERVEYVRSNGTHVAEMFVMFVCQRLDTVDRNATQGMALSPHVWSPFRTLAELKPHLIPPGADLDAKAKLVFNLDQVGGAHLWRDKHVGHCTYASNDLVTAIKESGLTGFGGGPQDTV